MEHYTVKFLPDNIDIKVKKGETILSCSMDAGIYLNSSCGGDGVCGRCRVIIKKGISRRNPPGELPRKKKSRGMF